MLQKVKTVRDESSHWYVLPIELIDEFHKDESNEDFVDSGKFDEKYGNFRTGGDLNLVQLYAELNNDITIDERDNLISALEEYNKLLSDCLNKFNSLIVSHSYLGYDKKTIDKGAELREKISSLKEKIYRK